MCLKKRAMFNLDINLFIFKNIIYIYAKKDEIYYWSLHAIYFKLYALQNIRH